MKKMKRSILSTIVSLASAASLARRQTINNPVTHLFVFGDSYSSSGFNNSSPAPSVAFPLGFPPLGPYPDLLDNEYLRSCMAGGSCNNQNTANGPNWIEFLTAKYNASTTLTYDFAAAGADIVYAENFERTYYDPKYASLYQPLALQPGNWDSGSSVFAAWLGINDINYCSLLFAPPGTTFENCLPPRFETYLTLMEDLYQTGARNFFFVNLPPLPRAPFVLEQNQTIRDNIAHGQELFNKLLPGYVQNFTESHVGVKTVIYDAYSFFGKILDDPTAYGFKDSTCYSCIGCYNVTGCFWTNYYHPDTHLHDLLAEDMLTDLQKVGWPVQGSLLGY